MPDLNDIAFKVKITRNPDEQVVFKAILIGASASQMAYDNSTSGLEATNVQSAIDEVNAKVDGAVADSYTKAQTDALLDLKADKSTTYTKTETDGLLASKANASDVYSKAQTYNKTEIDSSMALKADASDVYDKTEIDGKFSDVDDALALKADIDGEYDQLTAGLAKQLKSNIVETDSEPYLFRSSGGSIDIGDRETDQLVGGTVAFNQQVSPSNLNTASEVLGITRAFVEPNGLRYTGTSTSSTNFTAVRRIENFVAGHKYLLSLGNVNLPTGTRLNVSAVDKCNETIVTVTMSDVSFGIVINSDIEVDFVVYPVAFDLTLMFGTAVADYMFNLERATAGAGVAFFRKLFPKPYYEYNAGELISVKTSAHKLIGFNAWDEETESGSINSLGQDTPSQTQIRTKNYVRVLANTTYYLKTPKNVGIFYYDASKTLISSALGTANSTFTTPSNCAFIRWYFIPDYGTTYNHDTCINLSWDGERDGEYQPYVEHVYPLDADLELRGIPKLNADNKLFYDGDTYSSDGSVVRNKYITRLTGNESTFEKSSNAEHCFQVSNSNYPSQYRPIGNIWRLETTYTFGFKEITETEFDVLEGIYTRSTYALILSLPSCSTIEEAKAYLSSHPVFVGWDINPFTETADEFTNPQIVDDFGTEEYVDSRAIPLPVGHYTEYQANLRAKLEMMPDSPSGNGDYIMRQTAGLNAYVPLIKELPAMPSTDGNYQLKCSVSGGIASLSWEEIT